MFPGIGSHHPLYDIATRVASGTRLDRADGLRLFESSDLNALGAMAHAIRQRQNGSQTYFIVNRHINYTNICGNECRFCAYYRTPDAPDAHSMTLSEVYQTAQNLMEPGVTEFHIVGGLDPKLPYAYYTDMLAGLRHRFPDIHLQAFTMVEIDDIAAKGSKTIREALSDLRQAGLGSLPGGGAEVFSTRVRDALCRKKISAERWLEIARTAHQMGIRSNATMLYGHIESLEERVDHLLALRKLQDETHGFMAFIPLAFHPCNTQLSELSHTTGVDDLKMVAVSRLLLDNFEHIKTFWIMAGPKLAQVAQLFGADDIDGTVMEERIFHSAGAGTAQSMTRRELIHLIQDAGLTPVERHTVYAIQNIWNE